MISKVSAATLALTAGLLQGCTQPLAPVSHAVVYSTDLQGKAAVCTVPNEKLAEGKSIAVTMVTSGGGWCGLPVQYGAKPYSAGLVTQRPEKGKVFIHTVGDDTRIDYVPLAAITPDTFTVKLIPGDAEVKVTVQPATAGAAK